MRDTCRLRGRTAVAHDLPVCATRSLRPSDTTRAALPGRNGEPRRRPGDLPDSRTRSTLEYRAIRANVTGQDVEDQESGDTLRHRPDWVGGLAAWEAVQRETAE